MQASDNLAMHLSVNQLSAPLLKKLIQQADMLVVLKLVGLLLKYVWVA